MVSGTGSYKVGIIEIPNFYIDFEAYHRGDLQFKSTTSDVKKLLFELAKENIDGLIIDLRDNGGGSLKEASDLTGLFLKTGPTVQIRTKQQMTRLYDEDPEIQYTGPLLVLINRMSASASEIFAGAIKDYHRGIIVGTQSFGKGTVQELKPLGDGKLKLTSAKFYRVSGKSTQHRGVLPHISFPKIYKPDETGESSLDGALPWDTIPSIPFQAYPTLTQLYEPLALAFQKRRETDPGMIYLENDWHWQYSSKPATVCLWISMSDNNNGNSFSRLKFRLKTTIWHPRGTPLFKPWKRRLRFSTATRTFCCSRLSGSWRTL